jgi:hypothetical protein
LPLEDLQVIVNNTANALMSISLDGIQIDDLTIVLLSMIIVLGDQILKTAQSASRFMDDLSRFSFKSSIEFKSVYDQIMSETNAETDSDFVIDKEEYDDDYERMNFMKPRKNNLKWTCKSRKRPNHSKPVIEILKKWLHSHQSHPYPTEKQKSELCKSTGLSMLQLNNWFINGKYLNVLIKARRRLLKG